MTAGEAYGFSGFFFRGTEIDEGGAGADFTRRIKDLRLDESDITHLTNDMTTDSKHGLVGRNWFEILHLHLAGDTGGLQFARDNPTAHFVHQHGLHPAVQGIEPTLKVTIGMPLGDDVVAILPEVKMETTWITWATTDAVVAFDAKPGVDDLFQLTINN